MEDMRDEIEQLKAILKKANSLEYVIKEIKSTLAIIAFFTGGLVLGLFINFVRT